MTAQLVGEAAFAVVVVVVVVVLPGFGVHAVTAAAPTLLGRIRGAETKGKATPSGPKGRYPSDASAIVTAVALSLCYCVLVGSALLAFGAFTATRLGVMTLLAAVVGLVPFVRWCAGQWVRLGWHVLLVVALAAPVSLSVFSGGYRPAQSYQWFYWGLGRQLSTARGIPDHVLEWGDPVRWQPDYLNFNLLSQAYLGLMRGVVDPTAVAVWRVPLALFLLAMTFLVMRLWFSFVPSAVATAVLSGSNLYIDKIGNNSPEALGLAFGFVAVWLAVEGVRRGRSVWLLLAAVTGALTVSVHGVAATVCAMLVVAAVAVELVAIRPPLFWWLRALGLSVVTAIVVVSALGLSLQGRASPLGDAKNPAVVGDVDPTYKFVQFSNGRFTAPVDRNSLQSIATTPWPDSSLMSPHWSWLLALMVVGVAGVIVVGRSRQRRGVASAFVFAILVAAAVAWFELRYDTFVPQHTGNVRIASYLPIAYVILLAAGVEVICRLVLHLWREPRSLALQIVSGTAVTALAIGFFAVTTTQTMTSRPAISRTGAQALVELKDRAPSGSVVVSNVATRGTLEYFTSLEAPAEGRQPLIEDPRTLDSATEYLLRLHRFLQQPHRGQLRNELGATWLVIAQEPGELGTNLNYGKPRRSLAKKAGLDVVWRRGGISILKASGDGSRVDAVGSAKELWRGYLAGLVAMGLVVALAGVALARADGRLSRVRDEG